MRRVPSSLTPDSIVIASAGNDNLVRVWSAADGKLVPWLASQTDVLAYDWREVYD